MDVPSIALLSIFLGGVATGYALRAFISARRKARARAECPEPPLCGFGIGEGPDVIRMADAHPASTSLHVAPEADISGEAVFDQAVMPTPLCCIFMPPWPRRSGGR
jgi:hypothetical protein